MKEKCGYAAGENGKYPYLYIPLYVFHALYHDLLQFLPVIGRFLAPTAMKNLCNIYCKLKCEVYTKNLYITSVFFL